MATQGSYLGQKSLESQKEPDPESSVPCDPEPKNNAESQVKSSEFPHGMYLYVMEKLSRAVFASLLNDYVESEFFLIDGDSLQLTCVLDQSLKAGQHLHFFYLVESYLYKLTNRGAKYAVVFFEDMEFFYHDRVDLISLRTQLKLHLEHNTDTVIYTFSNFLSAQWNTFLIDHHPYFLMVCDEGVTLSQTYFFSMLMLSALGKKIDLVLTSGQEFDQLRVYGYHINATHHHNLYPIKKQKQFLQDLVDPCEKLYRKRAQKLNFSNTINEIEKSITLLFNNGDKALDIRSIMCILSCSAVLTIYGKKATHGECQASQDDSDLTLEEVADLCRMYCLSVAILLVLPLSQRMKSRNIHADWNSPVLACLDWQIICEHIILKKFSNTSNWKINWTHIADLSDGLLLKNIAYYYEKENNTGSKLIFGKAIEEKFSFLWNSILEINPHSEQIQSYDVRTTSRPFLSKASSIIVREENMPTIGLLRAKSDIVEEYAGDFLDELPFLSSIEHKETPVTRGKYFDELTHWHSGRPLSDDYDRTKGDEAALKDERALRDYQKLQTLHRFSGQSLVSSSSKTIVIQNDDPEKKGEKEKVIVKKKQPQKSKKDLIIEENQKRMNAKEETKDAEQWKLVASSIEKEMRANFFPGLKKLESFIKNTQTRSVKLLAELLGLRISFKVWVEHCCTDMSSEEEDDLNIAVEIMKKIQTLHYKYKDMLTNEDQQLIAQCLSYLGFENLACTLPRAKVTSAREDKKKAECMVGVGAARFQLQFMSPYLVREERTDPDPRVQHFIPDTWQRKLLDVVDNNESAVIVAPTSSGKTYASYYCMQKVLSQGHEGVVVYVSPTKALVNQVVTTVMNQFNKNLPNGVALCGVFTRDYRTDALNSQILVTVPQCLEILLLSPHRQEWAKRIKYVIFDEIHCLGGEIGAEVWEHLLVMIRCPFLALSATISNPEHLTEWLQSVKFYWQKRDKLIEENWTEKGAKAKAYKKKEKMSYRVHLVIYNKRYNDLEKYVCSVQDSNVSFEHYHPCAALTTDHMEKYGIPNDLSCSPRESLQLYDTMVDVWPEWARREELDPEEYAHFKDRIIITKNDTKIYEEELKKELIDWIKQGNQEKVSQLLKYLQPPKSSCNVDRVAYFPKLVEKLKEEQKLPALLFAFNIGLVEHLAQETAIFLKNKQDNKTKLLTEKKSQKLITKAKRLEKAIAKNEPSKVNDAFLANVANHKSIEQVLIKDKEIPPDCTYADTRAVNNELLWEVFRQTSRSRDAKCLRFLAERGVGYHHASLDVKGRRQVEMLFRMGYLRVVTATGSLALGINMPCKSVVFVQDSLYLDALNYRQMSGRAGRRGQDVLGNVYFFTIPMPKVKRLMKSDVPNLKGQFPLGISFVLRLMLLAAKADHKEDASAKALSVLKHSLMAFKKPSETKMLKLYFLFCIHFLIHEGYLDQHCNPLDFTGLVTHLHYHEPSNFVFVSFLENGLFHRLCQRNTKGSNRFPQSVMETLVLVLANLFGRSYLLPSMLELKGTFKQSKVFLEGLPDDFAAALEDYNSKISAVFGQYLLAVSHLANYEQEYKLPLSQINFSGEECEDSELVNHLMNCTKRRSAITPFACLSGNTDHDLTFAAHLDSILLQTSHVSEKHIPRLHLENTDACGRKLLLNAYALDFFKHSSIDALETDNGFHKGDAFYKLRDFSLCIATIRVSLKEMCEDEDDPVVLAFEQLNTLYREKLETAYPRRRIFYA
uniref:DEXD/H-box helicase 60 n=1 Tax=Xenopus tropicalis TaxID=8364 RepID=A0A803JIA1_XENTR